MSATNHANTYRRRKEELTSRRNEDEEASALPERDCIFVRAERPSYLIRRFVCVIHTPARS